MIRHLFKLIWNRKGKNFLLIVEIFFCFVVVFWVSSIAVYSIRNYAVPLGFTYDDLYYMEVARKDTGTTGSRETLEQLKLKLKSMPEVKGLTVTQSVPFVNWGNNAKVVTDASSATVSKWDVDDDFARILNIKMIKGRWFNNSDNVARNKPVVITADLEEKYFSNHNGLGKIMKSGDEEFMVVGVCANTRSDAFSVMQPGFYTRILPDQLVSTMLLKVSAANRPEFEARLMNESNQFARKSTGTWEVDGAEMTDIYFNQVLNSYFQFTIICIVSGFLIFNVVIGLFGVLWLSITQRTAEIGVRRAMGANMGNIYKQILLEALILASFGVAPGFLLAVQFPLLNVLGGVEVPVFVLSIIITILVVYGLVAVCALYPSRRAAKIQPALALHEN
jgi:putative ABC transport system permease protein